MCSIGRQRDQSMTSQSSKSLRIAAGGAPDAMPGAVRQEMELKSAIVKRSIELNGHKTSVSLEDEFWLSLRQIAVLKDITLPVLLQSIDRAREGANLSSAIRVYVLNHYRILADTDMTDAERARCPLNQPAARS